MLNIKGTLTFQISSGGADALPSSQMMPPMITAIKTYLSKKIERVSGYVGRHERANISVRRVDVTRAKSRRYGSKNTFSRKRCGFYGGQTAACARV